MGIRKVNHADELWPILEELGDRQSFYVLEKFVPGDVFHVDSIVWNKQVIFTVCSQYGQPPMAVYQGGGVFISSNLAYHTPEEQALQALNREVIAAMGMVRGVTHAEFIRAEADGAFHFLEIAARVGGANIDLMLEHATGLNLWREWARLEVAHLRKEEYTLPPIRSPIRRAGRFARQRSLARHQRLRRPGAGLAAEQGASRRLHRHGAGARPRAAACRRLRRPHRPGFHGHRAAKGRRTPV
jgi:biotin carboxylase